MNQNTDPFLNVKSANGNYYPIVQVMEEGKSHVNVTSMPTLLSAKQVAAILGCHTHQIYRYLTQGFLQDCLVKFGNSRIIRFNSAKIRRNIEAGLFNEKKSDLNATQTNYDQRRHQKSRDRSIWEIGSGNSNQNGT